MFDQKDTFRPAMNLNTTYKQLPLTRYNKHEIKRTNPTQKPTNGCSLVSRFAHCVHLKTDPQRNGGPYALEELPAEQNTILLQ
ncbi:hypothetical protein Hanom_Chr09g00782291 [Helianthus anomalus]